MQNYFQKKVSTAHKMLGINKDRFRKCLCPTCSELYLINKFDMKKGTNGKCAHIKFPDHPQIWRRKPCGTELLKKVKTSAGTTTYKPRQVYSYKSIITSMKELFLS